MALGAIIGGVASIAGGIFGNRAAKRAARRARRQARKLEKKLAQLERNRQAIIDPYSNVTDLSSMIKNPFTQLSVATKSTEIQIEQADIALANTLDTIRATGASAGGATALAQAALQSKQGVAANIEQQEVRNEKLRVEGEKQKQQELMSEQQRQQQADVAGDQFTFQVREGREMQQMDRVSNQISALRGQAAAARRDGTAAITGAISGVASALGGLGGGKNN
jgi:uncharacterized membrane-anchored protein YhcB (DUF1043 family)